MANADVLSIDDIQDAAARLKGVAVRTPLLNAPLIDDRVGARVYFKPECLQRTGSFKFRGAYNSVAQLSEDQASRGVVAFSSGNHAQGVAAAATARGISAKIVMPADAPAIKLRNTRAYGGEVITYDRQAEDRAAIAATIAESEGRHLIPPYDYLPVLAGQGTTGIEVADDLDAIGAVPTQAICPAGGGGLISGFSTAMKDRYTDINVFSAEPENYDDTKRSLESGQIQEADITVPSPCDALLAPRPGDMTMAVIRETLTGGFAVSNETVFEAMRAAFNELKLVVEPGGAVALAALLDGQISLQPDDVVVIVISGGNVDPALFKDMLANA